MSATSAFASVSRLPALEVSRCSEKAQTNLPLGSWIFAQVSARFATAGSVNEPDETIG